MQSNHLSEVELNQLRDLLTKWVLEKGSEILGSQLGVLIFKASGRPVREFGGIRGLVTNELHSFIEVSDFQLHPPDVDFCIKNIVDETISEGATTHRAHPSTGAEAWRIFSNPNLVGQIGVDRSHEFVVVPSASEFPADVLIFSKPTQSDYKQLAAAFAGKQPPEIKSQLTEVLSLSDFYNDWIQQLRSLSAGSQNFLRAWESTRAAFVAERLIQELTKSGVALDVAKAQVTQVQPRKSLKPGSLPTQPYSHSIPQHSVTTNDSESTFRQMVHAAIDLMSIDDLRRLPLAAGQLYDASLRILK